MKTRMRITAAITTLTQLWTLALPALLWGGVDNTFNPNAVNTSALKAVEVDCAQFCKELVDDAAVSGMSDDDKKGLNLTDKDKLKQYMKTPSSDGNGSSWTGADDKWCAQHGVATDPSVMPTATPVPLTTDAAKSCNVTMVKGVGTLKDDTDCKKTSDNIFRCQMYNTQIIPQCLAYEAVTRAAGLQETVMGLDIAATVACGAACAALATGVGVVAEPVTQPLCQLTGAAAGVTEMVSVFAMSSGPVQSIISGIGAAGGLGATAWGLSNAGDSGGWGVGLGSSTNKELTQASEQANKEMQNFGGTADEAIKKGEEATEKAEKASQGAKDAAQETRDKQRQAACMAAAFFGVVSGLRKWNMDTYEEKLKKDACKAVQDLASSAITPGGGAAGAGGGNSNGGYAGPTGNGNGSGSGANGGGGNTGGGTTDGSGTTQTSCTGVNGCSNVPPTQARSTDGGNLIRSGLDKALGPKTAEIADLLKKGLTPGQIIQGAMGGGNPEMAAAFGALATAAQEHASDLMGAVNLGMPSSAYSGGGGSGGGGSRSSDSSNPFASLFGGGAKDAAGRTPGSEMFGAHKQNDIWHTGTPMNIFEIVSGKVSQVTSRVGK